MSDRITLSAMRFEGHHGVSEEERFLPQPLEVDLEVVADLSRAGRTDDVADTIDYGPLVALVLQGPEAIEVVRLLNGATNGVVAAPGTVRGDFSLSNRENLVHASDSPDSAAHEIALWFPALG